MSEPRLHLLSSSSDLTWVDACRTHRRRNDPCRDRTHRRNKTASGLRERSDCVSARFAGGGRIRSELPETLPFHTMRSVAPSPSILNSPVLLLLGAGASAPLGKLLMNSFVEKLSKSVGESKPAAMLELLKKFRGSDLEAIMGELETITEMDYASSVDGSYRVQTRDSTGSTFSESTTFSLDRKTAVRLRSIIRHEVIREFRDINGEQAVHLYGPLFDCIFSPIDPKRNCLVIFTTNYDPAIEVFCREKHKEYNLCDGFAYDPSDRHNYWHRSVFDDFQLDPYKRNLVLFLPFRQWR